MPSLDQFAERIIDLVHTCDPGSASIAVMTADAFTVALRRLVIDTERAFDASPRRWRTLTRGDGAVIHAIKRRSSTPGWWHHSARPTCDVLDGPRLARRASKAASGTPGAQSRRGFYPLKVYSPLLSVVLRD